MTLNLPPEIEAIAKEKAAKAGLSDVGSFVERLIENASPEQALLPPPSDPRIIAAINAGFESGVEGEIDEDFWQERRRRLDGEIAKKHGPEA